MENSDNSIELPLLSKSSEQVRAAKAANYSRFEDIVTLPDEKERYQTKQSFWKTFYFADIFPLVKRINEDHREVAPSEIPLPYIDEINVEKKTFELDANWQKQLGQKNPNFVRALYDTFKSEWYKRGIGTLIVCTLHFISTLILGKMIQIITMHNLGENMPITTTIMWAILFGVTYYSTQYLEMYNWYYYEYFSLNVKNTIMNFVYKKLNCVALSSLQHINLGKVLNLLSNDLNDIPNKSIFLWPLLVSPYNVFMAGFLLWNEFGPYSLISLISQCLFVLLSMWISSKSSGMRDHKNKLTDMRIKYTNELIECIRLIKLYAWEKPFSKIINSLRLKETLAYMDLAQIEAFSKPIAEVSMFVSLFVTCILYNWGGGILTPTKVYFTISILFFTKRRVLFHCAQGTLFLVNFQLMKKRLEDILFVKDILSLKDSFKRKKSKSNSSNSSVISFSNFTASWSEDQSKPCLDNISTVIPQGKITAVIGKIGAGKTSFLLSFLDEIPFTSGKVTRPSNIAYVEQEPIVFSDSIRENILFGQEYDELFYKEVIKACGLDQDLKQLDHGDQTLVGERGVTLSGGQRARVSLARAVYSRNDVYLLDDPLSAVDSKVGKQIFENVIKKVLKGKTVILVTHHLSYAKEADNVIVFDEGKIIAQGTFEEVQNKDINLLKLFAKENESQEVEEEKIPAALPRISSTRSSVASETSLQLNEEEQTLEQEAATSTSLSTYINYFKQSGNLGLVYVTLAIYLASALCMIGFTRYVGYWADEQNKAYYLSQQNNTPFEFNNTPYLLVCGIFIVGSALFMYLKLIMTIKFFLTTNSKLHEKMLNSISRSIVYFFDKTPSGRIVNRFSNDLGAMDKNTWLNVVDFLHTFFDWALVLIYLCLTTFHMIIPLSVTLYFLVKIKNFCSRALILSKKMELAALSPVYSEISSTLSGLIIIRVYKQGARFIQKFLDLVYQTTKVSYTQSRIQRIFGVLLQTFVYFLVVTGLFIFIIAAYYGGLDSALFGLALYYFIMMGTNSVFMIRLTMFIDINMQSAQRMLEFTDIEQEAPNELYADKQVLQEHNDVWPSQGEVSFQNVHLKYRGASRYALCGVDFTIPAGSKIGIVGRTGAGKSSLLQALFRMAEIEEIPGSQIRIDGVHIKRIGLEFLRKNICIIPQTPIIFSGTIRRNLDPFDEVPDSKLWEVLEEVNLKTYVEQLDKKLDTEIGFSSSIFSAGQKQLICLARVLLKKSKLLILDEATANVDIETDDFIQNKIKEKFAGATIMTIAHRLTTIADYDKIMVLEKGRIEEFDHPYKLLVEKVGDPTITRKNGMFAKMVLNNGEKTANKIFEIAYASYEWARKHKGHV